MSGTTAHDSLGGRFHARKPDDFRALGILDMARPTVSKPCVVVPLDPPSLTLS